MFGLKSLSFATLIVCFGSSCVYAAISMEEAVAIHKALHPFLAQCGEEFSYTEDKIESLNFDDLSSDYCFASCFYKKSEIFKDGAMFNADKATEIFKLYVNDEEKIEKFTEVTEECAKANEVEVSDGDEGCERAKLVVECFNIHKAAFRPEDD